MWNNPPGNWPRASPLEFLITRATTAAQPENNYALHIEIAEHINKKKANTYLSFPSYVDLLELIGIRPVHARPQCSSFKQSTTAIRTSHSLPSDYSIPLSRCADIHFIFKFPRKNSSTSLSDGSRNAHHRSLGLSCHESSSLSTAGRRASA